MDHDDEICCCYHVTLRKLVNFARRVRPRTPSQMSECLGAGTGCGWCIPILCKIARSIDDPDFRLTMSPEQYAAERAQYRSERRPRHQFEPLGPPPDAGAGPAEAAEPPETRRD